LLQEQHPRRSELEGAEAQHQARGIRMTCIHKIPTIPLPPLKGGSNATRAHP
jgi:hypothetical protein